MVGWPHRTFLIACLAALPIPAPAHTGHGASAWLKSARWGDDGLRVVVEILNDGGGAVTLRGVACPEATTVVFTRRHSVLGLVTEQPVALLRLDPDELVRLGDGRYRLELIGVQAAATGLGLMLDFGPDGMLRVAVPVPPR